MLISSIKIYNLNLKFLSFIEIGRFDLNIDKSTLQEKGEIIVMIFYFEKDFILDRLYMFWLNFCQLWKKFILLK